MTSASSALGTYALRRDQNNPRNLTPPIFDAQNRAQLTFGANNAATIWKLTRSTDLLTFTEIFRFEGSAYIFDNTQIGVLDNGTDVTVIDRAPPSPKAFYRFEALAPCGCPEAREGNDAMTTNEPAALTNSWSKRKTAVPAVLADGPLACLFGDRQA